MGFSDLGKKLSKLGQDTKNGVQKVSDSVSISNRISQEKKSLERLFALIGEAVYKEDPDSPKAGLEDEWAAVKVAYSNIAAYTEQLNHIKGIVYCPNCGRPAANGDKFCAKCGFKLDNRPESTGAKMAKDLKEAGQEVGRIAEDAADKTGEAVGGAAAGTRNAFSWLKEKLRKPKKEDGKETPEAEKEAAAISAEEASGAEAVTAKDAGSAQETAGMTNAGAAAGAAAEDSDASADYGSSKETAADIEAAADAGLVQETAADAEAAADAGSAQEKAAESFETAAGAGFVQETAEEVPGPDKSAQEAAGTGKDPDAAHSSF